MKDKVWEVEYEGHVIRVVLEHSFKARSKPRRLEIDGAIIKYSEIFNGHHVPTIHAYHSINNTRKHIEVRFGEARPIPKFGCQIYIDGQFVFGDKSIRYIEYNKIKKMYDRGFFLYILMKFLPIILFALSVSFILCTSLGWTTDKNTFFQFAIPSIPALLVISYFSWGYIKARAEKEAEFNE